MSYSFTVRVKADGEMTVVKNGGEIPSGTYTVSGHQDRSHASIMVQQHDETGRYKITASHTHTREQLEDALTSLPE